MPDWLHASMLQTELYWESFQIFIMQKLLISIIEWISSVKWRRLFTLCLEYFEPWTASIRISLKIRKTFFSFVFNNLLEKTMKRFSLYLMRKKQMHPPHSNSDAAKSGVDRKKLYFLLLQWKVLFQIFIAWKRSDWCSQGSKVIMLKLNCPINHMWIMDQSNWLVKIKQNVFCFFMLWFFSINSNSLSHCKKETWKRNSASMKRAYKNPSKFSLHKCYKIISSLFM